MQSQKSSSSTFKSFFSWLVLSLLVFIGTTAFKNSGEESPLSSSKIGSLTEDIRKNEVLAWQLNHNYDHYGPGSMVRADPKNPQFLILASNRTFVAFDVNEKREGRWEVDYEENIIIFYCDEINGERVQEPMSYQFLVRDYSASSLKMAWQGRHGLVDMVYTPVNRSVKGSAGLSSL